MSRNRRLELHDKLLKYVDYAYYAVPENFQVKFPCVVYSKSAAEHTYSGNKVYTSQDLYRLTFMSKTIDSNLHEKFLFDFPARLINRFVTNNVEHTVLELYY